MYLRGESLAGNQIKVFKSSPRKTATYEQVNVFKKLNHGDY